MWEKTGMQSVKNSDINNGLDETKFDIIKSLVSYVLDQIKHEDDHYMQLMCYTKKMDTFVDEIEEDEYNELYESFLKDLNNILSILNRSEENFNKRMIF